jgi:hypothetical protein
MWSHHHFFLESILFTIKIKKTATESRPGRGQLFLPIPSPRGWLSPSHRTDASFDWCILMQAANWPEKVALDCGQRQGRLNARGPGHRLEEKIAQGEENWQGASLPKGIERKLRVACQLFWPPG